MAGPLNKGVTVINTHFVLLLQSYRRYGRCNPIKVKHRKQHRHHCMYRIIEQVNMAVTAVTAMKVTYQHQHQNIFRKLAYCSVNWIVFDLLRFQQQHRRANEYLNWSCNTVELSLTVFQFSCTHAFKKRIRFDITSSNSVIYIFIYTMRDLKHCTYI